MGLIIRVRDIFVVVPSSYQLLLWQHSLVMTVPKSICLSLLTASQYFCGHETRKQLELRKGQQLPNEHELVSLNRNKEKKEGLNFRTHTHTHTNSLKFLSLVRDK